MNLVRRYVLLLSLLHTFVLLKAEDFTYSDSVKVSKIWDQAGHQAFTDLIRFKKAFYCSFREGENHVASASSGKILNSDKLLVGTRAYAVDTTTSVYTTDLQGNIIRSLKLPSGGDNSYTGLVIFKNKIWVSYYSSHEGKSSIYLAIIPIAMIN